jgi:hypothetical protein
MINLWINDWPSVPLLVNINTTFFFLFFFLPSIVPLSALLMKWKHGCSPEWYPGLGAAGIAA